jgi:hypothetical protein
MQDRIGAPVSTCAQAIEYRARRIKSATPNVQMP